MDPEGRDGLNFLLHTTLIPAVWFPGRLMGGLVIQPLEEEKILLHASDIYIFPQSRDWPILPAWSHDRPDRPILIFLLVSYFHEGPVELLPLL